MRIVAIDHVVLPVTDVEASLAFYERVLGLVGVRVEAFRAGKVGFASFRVGDALLDLAPRPAGTPPLDHVCLRVDAPIETVVDELRRAGIRLENDPALRFGAEGEGRSVYVRDPSGNTLEIKSAAGA